MKLNESVESQPDQNCPKSHSIGLFLFFLVCENLASASSLARTQGWLFCDSSSWHGVLGKGERGQMLYLSKISREIKSLYNYFFDLCWCFFSLSKTGVTTPILPKCAEMMTLLDNLTKMHSQAKCPWFGTQENTAVQKKSLKKSLFCICTSYWKCNLSYLRKGQMIVQKLTFDTWNIKTYKCP